MQKIKLEKCRPSPLLTRPVPAPYFHFFSKDRRRKYILFSTQEFHVTNLQLNKLHNKTLQNQVSVMVSIITSWDWGAVFKFMFVPASAGIKDFCSFLIHCFPYNKQFRTFHKIHCKRGISLILSPLLRVFHYGF